MNTSELLANYRKTGSDAAFTSLLRQYTNLVYSVAKRRLSDQSLAEDVTQTVFTRLAKSPPIIKSDGELAAWLHRTTIHVAIDVWRSETRRHTREQKVALMQTLPGEDARLWEELTPHLDEALNQLADADRQAVLLRFFEQKPMRDIGGILGVSEDAAKMRVSRAVDRLRNQLSLRGITCTVLVLATVLAQRTVEAAPAQLFATLTAIKLAVPAVAGAGGLSGLILHLAKSKAVLGSAAAVVLTIIAVALFGGPGKTNMTQTSGEQPDFSQTQPVGDGSQQSFPKRAAVRSEPIASEIQDNVRFLLRVVDKETGAGLAGARVRAAYFYAGGVGERHELQTDVNGNATIPLPNVPGKNAGLNVFVGIEGYVPKAMGFGRPSNDMKDYLLELDPALAVGGTVVDESGLPVAGVTIEALRSEDHKSGAPNTDFQTTKVTTDAGTVTTHR
jgi:RNA polymerase sigma factor (sigma-70 family)